jgi:hypothetical protein
MMPTYAQLNQETAFRNEYTTEPMRWFCQQAAGALGVPQANVGAKGDNLHLNGGHRSQRWILTSKWCTNRTYTVWGGLPAHLMDALGAVDITPKSREQMLLISQRVDAAMRAGLIDEVVAYYGNTNNDTRVDGWDNIRNAVTSSDSSHLWHLHLTFNRWAVGIRSVFERLLKILLGQPLQEEDVSERLEWLAHQFETLENHYPPSVMGGRETKFITEFLQMRDNLAEIKADARAGRQAVEALTALVNAGGGDIDTAAVLARMDELAAEEKARDDAEREAQRKAAQAAAIVHDDDPTNDPDV